MSLGACALVGLMMGGGACASASDSRMRVDGEGNTARSESRTNSPDLALANDESETTIEASGDSVIDKRLATVEANLSAQLNATVEAALAKLSTGETAQNVAPDQSPTATGEGASADAETNVTDTDQMGAFNTAITIAGGGIGGVGTLWVVLRFIRLWSGKNRSIELERYKLGEGEQTERMRIIGKSNLDLVQHSHDNHSHQGPTDARETTL